MTQGGWFGWGFSFIYRGSREGRSDAKLHFKGDNKGCTPTAIKIVYGLIREDTPSIVFSQKEFVVVLLLRRRKLNVLNVLLTQYTHNMAHFFVMTTILKYNDQPSICILDVPLRRSRTTHLYGNSHTIKEMENHSDAT